MAERLSGTTMFHDDASDEVICSTVQLEAGRAWMRWRIVGRRGGEGRVMESTHRVLVWAARYIIQAIRAENRRTEPVTQRWKPEPEPPPYRCGVCHDRRMLEDPATGEEWPCPACGSR